MDDRDQAPQRKHSLKKKHSLRKKKSRTDDEICAIKHNIAVIGAGASGIIVGKRLKEAGIDCTLFEQRPKTGGMWNYDKRSEDLRNPLYDSVYTQLPKEVMEFWGEPWDAEGEKTASHQPWMEVCKYLDRVAKNSSLEENTCFGRIVTKMEPLGGPSEHKGFNVTSEGVTDKSTRTEFFTGVAVCNGHYSEPVWPEIPDKDLYSQAGGSISHSVKYTNADGYENKRVVVVSGGPLFPRASAARDLCTELTSAGANVIMSIREPIWDDFKLKGVKYTASIKNINDMRVVTFADGTNSGGPVDEIICATGYDYAMPFVDEDIAPVNTVAKNGYKGVDNLYLNLFNIKYPTLWFVGLPDGVVPWPLADSQAKAIVSVLTGVTRLPDFKCRIRAYGEELTSVAANPHSGDMDDFANVHAMAGRKSWMYIMTMLEFAKDPEHRPNVLLRARVHSECGRRRKLLPDDFRSSNYTLTTCNDDFIGGGYFEVDHPEYPVTRRETDLTRQGGLDESDEEQMKKELTAVPPRRIWSDHIPSFFFAKKDALTSAPASQEHSAKAADQTLPSQNSAGALTLRSMQSNEASAIEIAMQILTVELQTTEECRVLTLERLDNLTDLDAAKQAELKNELRVATVRARLLTEEVKSLRMEADALNMGPIKAALSS